MRVLVIGNLLLGILVYAASIPLQAYGDATTPNQGASLWFYVLCAVGLIACLVCWGNMRHDDQWRLSSRGAKWLCFFVTPWGAMLALGIGLIILILAVAGVYSSSSGSGGGGSGGKVTRDRLGKYPYNSWEAQREREQELALHSAVQRQNRQREEVARTQTHPPSNWTWGTYSTPVQTKPVPPSTLSGVVVSPLQAESSNDPTGWRDPTKPLFGKGRSERHERRE
jgi:hypothetical protein